MVAGGSSSTPGAYFWGSEGEEEGQQEVHGGGGGAQDAGCSGRSPPHACATRAPASAHRLGHASACRRPPATHASLQGRTAAPPPQPRHRSASHCCLTRLRPPRVPSLLLPPARLRALRPRAPPPGARHRLPRDPTEPAPPSLNGRASAVRAPPRAALASRAPARHQLSRAAPRALHRMGPRARLHTRCTGPLAAGSCASEWRRGSTEGRTEGGDKVGGGEKRIC
ncbi:hypothetical protein PAHAL_6G146600 [Panicum hallii]|uniref:Uncharacterized protein n=1 Tax=Panicum hallii TaxID=206008 RepID=A0A2T8IGA5_9POAL|nr:hypothetical protein PAHAL_6G146600 [Panicum hallii]